MCKKGKQLKPGRNFWNHITENLGKYQDSETIQNRENENYGKK